MYFYLIGDRWEIVNKGISNLQKKKAYNFDNAYGPQTTTQELFDDSIEKMIWQGMDGYDGKYTLNDYYL